MKRENPIFKGVATALITPLDENGVNYDQMKRLIDWQIDQGVDALLIAGTSGEGSTLSDAEHRKTLEFAADYVAGRVPVIAGTGSNDTAYGQSLSKFACEVGCDALLVVTPYYNKCTQNGLVDIYGAYSEVATKPIIVYNIASRTGVDIKPETFVKLAELDNIVAIKEASGNISQITDTMSQIQGKLDVYSGNDDQIIPIMSVGGLGVISVISNVMPKETKEMTTRFFNGDIAGAAELQLRLRKLIKLLFCEVNPIPVKAAMSAMGFCDNYVRLPLTKMEEAHYAELIAEMRNQGVNV
ncbi:MAG: 4-hydroxy-tetrahydrodipicolinate synthase [Eubacteriales bacterium]|nr:4-hydroxy-tetrahydrodipicolinate synthase [Eubacteriales bacterium]